jgi:GT2 family glycosyltransferase
VGQNISISGIVVDSSTDGTAEVVRQYPRVRLVKLSKRAYSGAARNAGIAESSAPVVLFMDSDVIVEPNWVDKMLDWHDREECAVVAGAVLNGNPESLVGWASYITEFSEYLPVGKPRYKLTGVTANFSCKRWALDKYNGFNPSLKQYVDTEFNCRLNSGGDKLLFVPTILAKHKHRSTLREYLRHEIGRGRSAVAVRRCGYLPYSRIARYRSLCVLLAGPVFVRMVCSTLGRFVRAGMVPLWQVATVMPISLLGSMAWTAGFLSEAVRPRIDLNEFGRQCSPAETVQTSQGGNTGWER